jgi:hypothetical protein
MDAEAPTTFPTEQREEARDRRFSAWRRAKSQAARDVVAEALRLTTNYEAHFKIRQRARRPGDQRTFEETVEALLCDAVHRHLTEEGGWFRLPLSNRFLGTASRYRPRVLSKALPRILQTLTSGEMVYLEVVKGVRGFRHNLQTTVRAGERLRKRIIEHNLGFDDLRRIPGEETIVLKAGREGAKEAEWVDYKDTSAIRRMRADMARINNWLADAAVDFDEWYAEGRGIDPDERFLRRIFNERFDSGGRLFGGFWQTLTKAQRAAGLTIGGEKVATLDYGQAGPRILYGLSRQQPPEDSYRVPGYERHREGWKRLLNALMYSSTKRTNYPEKAAEHFPSDLTARQAIKALLAFHAPVAEALEERPGMWVMHVESNIMVDVLLALIDRKVVALPVHDAVLVRQSNVEVAEHVMEGIFHRHSGVAGRVSVSL